MKSFEIDHTKLDPGIYFHSKSGFVTTWDVRIKKPNGGEYLEPKVIHTIEHTLAKSLRDKYGNYKIVGIFPMGCQTGFYVLTRFINKKEIFNTIANYIFDLQRMIPMDIPGNTDRECGQAHFHDLEGAKEEMLNYYRVHLKYQGEAQEYKN